ncbi:MAG: GIY-YIG nuclease family protein [bacterium]
MYYVYLIRSLSDKKFYLGFTDDLRRRFKEHNLGLSQATRYRRPFELVYYEAHQNKKDVLARERFLKTGWGKNYLKRILTNYLRDNRQEEI